MEVIVVSWEKVTRPLSLGCLGIPNLIYKGWALQMWLWLQKTDQHRPWCGLDLPIQSQIKVLFDCSVITRGKWQQYKILD